MNILGGICDVRKLVNLRIERTELRWFDHLERMDHSSLVKQIYRGEDVGGRPAGSLKKRE